MSHYTCAVITPPPAAISHNAIYCLVDQPLAPHSEETSDCGWWDWWEIGGRWPRELCVGQGAPHVIAPLSWTWAEPTGGDVAYIAERKSLWKPDQVDACPATAINWDGMGAMRVDRHRAAYASAKARAEVGQPDWGDPADILTTTEDSYVRQRMEPWQTYRWLTADGTEARPEPWDVLGDDWLAERNTPAGTEKMKAAEAAYSASFRATIQAAAEAGHWVTVVDYHS
jgi:hypothetical protein